MASQNVGFDFVCPQAPDRAYGALTAGRTVPYASTAAAVAVISISFRYRGKTILIDPGDGSGAYEYWWRVGTADNQLVKKILYEQTIEFVIGDGGAFTPADGTSIYTNPALQNASVTLVGGDQGYIPFTPRAGFQSRQFDPVAGTITLVNTKFSQGSLYVIKFRQL